MLLLGMRFAGLDVDMDAAVAASREMLLRLQRAGSSFLHGGSHFVYLGGGPLYGIAAEGALKLQEMSCSVTQTYHPLEYRHGPVSLIDRGSVIVLLYHPDTRQEEERLAAELRAKGAFIVGFGGAGDLELATSAPADLRALVYLPALQLLGEQMAQARKLDTTAPRHLTKVVRIA
jgi:glucosamine--fructose-6-phosphate aminotransferase (isomerizing)